jgi:hypothetical protein
MQKAETICIKQEIRLLYNKKQQINKELYYAHIHVSNHWNNTWPNIEHTINQQLEVEMPKKYMQQNRKLYMLQNTTQTL